MAVAPPGLLERERVQLVQAAKIRHCALAGLRLGVRQKAFRAPGDRRSG